MAARDMRAAMATAEEFRKVYRYNRAVLDAFGRKLGRLPWAVASKDRGATWHSMAGVFHHIVGVYEGWLCYVAQGTDVDEAMSARRWNQLTSMREVLAFHDAVWDQVDILMDSLTDAGLRRQVKAPWQPKACTLEDALIQVSLEQAHHLGEIIAMLWQEDIRPPEMTWLATNWALEDAAERMRRGGRKSTPHRNS